MQTINKIIQERAETSVTNAKERSSRGENNISVPVVEELVDKITHNVQNAIPEKYFDAEIRDTSFYQKININYRNGKGLYLYGQTGVGKTYLMYATCRYIRARGIGATFWNTPSTIGRFKAMYSREGGGEESIILDIEETEVLFLDDMGAGKQTEWSVDILYRLINFRYENNLVTYIASNYSLEELAKLYDDRIVSRIVEMCEIVKIDGEDRRLKK